MALAMSLMVIAGWAAPALAQTYPGSGNIAISEARGTVTLFIDYDSLGACVGEPLMAFIFRPLNSPAIIFIGELNDSETFIFEEDAIAALEAAGVRAGDNLTVDWSGECTDGGSENVTVTSTTTLPSATSATATGGADESSLPVTQLALFGGIAALAGAAAVMAKSTNQ